MTRTTIPAKVREKAREIADHAKRENVRGEHIASWLHGAVAVAIDKDHSLDMHRRELAQLAMKALKRPREDRYDYCAACDKRMDVVRRFFLCAACVRKLPRDIRVRIHTSSDRDIAISARREALSYLGALDIDDVRMPPASRPPKPDCGHDESDLFDQINLLTGGTDQVCNRCGKVRYAEAV